MQSSRRARTVARPRQIAMFLAKQLTSRSLPEIGRKFDRDHTTVMHAVRKIEELITQDVSKWEKCLIIIANYLYKNSTVAFKDLNLMACLAELKNL
jgi:hypothetical protein